jgi:hypothetical protein
MRCTPSAVRLFHLVLGDLGRALGHLNHWLDYSEIMTDAEQVLRTLVPIEHEVRGDGEWYLARLQPYRAVEHHIAGLVLTFVDIADRWRASEALREQLIEQERLNAVVVGRETRMDELKREVNELCSKLGEAPRDNVDFETRAGDGADQRDGGEPEQP